MKHIANIITGFRIPLSIAMLCFPAFSARFFIAYLLCGFSDMIDGIIARKTGSESAFGAKLDTAADFVFMLAAAFRLIPFIHLPGWIWIWIAAIAMIRLGNAIMGVLCWKKPVFLHTALNKAVGLLLFFLPMTMEFVEVKYSAAAICALAMAAAIQEGCCIRKGKCMIR